MDVDRPRHWTVDGVFTVENDGRDETRYEDVRYDGSPIRSHRPIAKNRKDVRESTEYGGLFMG